MALYGGIETGGTNTACVIGSDPDSIVAETRFATTTPAETIGRIIGFFREHTATNALAALGIASFGPVDLDPDSRTYGFITTTPKPGWSDVDLCGPLADALRVPLAFDTDVNAAALGEYLWGEPRGAGGTSRSGAAPGATPPPDPLLYLTVGTGIGMGAVVHELPVHGLIHPEAGHMRLPHDQGLDPFAGACPAHGDCWEGLASGAAIEKRWGQRGETLPPDHPAWQLEARYLGQGIANLICCFSPRRVVVGGGVMQVPGLLERVRTEVQAALGGYLRSEALGPGIERLIIPPRLGSRSGLLGALALRTQVRPPRL